MFDCFRYWQLAREYNYVILAYHEASGALWREDPFSLSRELTQLEIRIEGLHWELESLGKIPDWCTEEESTRIPD